MNKIIICHPSRISLVCIKQYIIFRNAAYRSYKTLLMDNLGKEPVFFGASWETNSQTLFVIIHSRENHQEIDLYAYLIWLWLLQDTQNFKIVAWIGNSQYGYHTLALYYFHLHVACESRHLFRFWFCRSCSSENHGDNVVFPWKLLERKSRLPEQCKIISLPRNVICWLRSYCFIS